jgi:hypothetical protein
MAKWERCTFGWTLLWLSLILLYQSAKHPSAAPPEMGVAGHIAGLVVVNFVNVGLMVYGLVAWRRGGNPVGRFLFGAACVLLIVQSYVALR